MQEDKGVSHVRFSQQVEQLLFDELEAKTNLLFLVPSSSIVITFNSSSFIDYRHQHFIDYPLRLAVRFRTLGRISNGVLLSLQHRQSSSIIPFIILDHTNGKIELTILQFDERRALSPVTVSSNLRRKKRSSSLSH